MKRYVLPMMVVMCIAILTLFSCATGPQIPADQSNAQIMEEYCPETQVEDCVLVSRANEAGIDLRVTHDLLINTALLTDWILKEKVEPADISRFANGIRTFVSGGPVTGVDLFNKLFEDAEDARIAQALIRKNMPLIYTGRILDECSVTLVKVSMDDLELWAGEQK